MTLHRVSILDHEAIDYVIHVCDTGDIWCLERVGVVIYCERTQPKMTEAKTNGRVSGRGFLLPVMFAPTIPGYQFLLNATELRRVTQYSTKGERGKAAERLVVDLIKAKRLAPPIFSFQRVATPQEDKYRGVDMFAITSVCAEGSGLQVKWDGRVSETGNLFIQVETEAVTADWSRERVHVA